MEPLLRVLRKKSLFNSVMLKEFWEDDGEIRIGGRAGMVPFPRGKGERGTEIE
jgi:hypothetical protein